MELDIEEGEVVGELNCNFQNSSPAAKHPRNDRAHSKCTKSVSTVPEWQDDLQPSEQTATPRRKPKKRKKKLQHLAEADGAQRDGQHGEGLEHLEQPQYVDIYGKHVRPAERRAHFKMINI